MTPDQVRKIVRQEIYNGQNAQRFGGINAIPNHHHDGIDSLKINANSLIPSVSVSGSISFSSSDTYTIYLNSSFTPTFIQCYGNITGSGSELYMSIGSASLRPSFYLQPDTTRTVVTGNVEYPFVDPNLGVSVPLQSCCYIGAESTSSGNNMHSLVSEGHIVNIFYGSDIKARATITEFTRSYIKIQTTIDAGWTINGNFVIT